ncbi:hypothetical protein ACFFUB_09295 [Algimonas porphyrae]|uniref:Uncharacterized protein n=1 Tax=Algimonas porphyrae TaxID=1128113 RepID=A0ABQ5V2H7_9PROT|nr:hypothetical protein [Algimonas porphyrae]GLQ21691.1 hypothetical protein GCM10007854_26460 [Algimonas porphyrae]
MILRRFKAHVENENWFAVGIDFCIVVIGVFIGIQVANWNEVRAERERLATQLDGFSTELTMARDDLVSLEAYALQRASDASALRKRLSEDGPALTEEDFNRLAMSALRSTSLTVTYRNFDELSSSGGLSLLNDEALRDLMSQWDTQLSTIRTIDGTSEEFRATSVVPVFMSTFVLGNSFKTDDRYTNFTHTDRFEFDLQSVRQNLEFDNALSLRQVLAAQQANMLTDFRDISDELIAALEKSQP